MSSTSCPAAPPTSSSRGTGPAGSTADPAPRAAILVTGDEVLRGRIQERNAGPLARSLDARGVRVERVLVLGDDAAALAAALAALVAEGFELVCVSGGLGPTHDDVTMAAVAEATGRPLALDPTALAMVEAAGASRRVDAAIRRRVAEKQATLPGGAIPLPPPGTAPGCLLALPEHGDALVVVLPGPPWELAAMWAAATGREPLAGLLARARPPTERVLRVHATPESRVVAVLDRLPARTRDAVALGICAREGELELTLRVPPGAGATASRAAAAALEAALADDLGADLYSRDGADLDAVLARALDAAGESVAVAESCTGGGLGARLTTPPGASRRVLGGVIAYDDRVKVALLGVEPALLATHGAVSAECARAMAEGARAHAASDWALAVTGVAGPDGATPGKPVGLVYLALAGPDGTVAEELRLHGDREAIRARSVAHALHLLRRALARRAGAISAGS